MTNIVDIAVQNDDFRKHLSKGTLVLTRGIRANTSEDIKKIITKVRTFEKFDENNDPYNEHDFGAFDYKGKKIFWKILYFSPDVSNPKVTNRVLTVMYADEY